MLHLTNDDVDRLVSPRDALDAVRDAFRSWSNDEAAVQTRIRTGSGAAKLSTLGAVIAPGEGEGVGVLGAKVYATVNERFTFLVVLFSADDGEPLALLEADALTRLRTAATSVLAAQFLAQPSASRLLVYGSGVQARGHIDAFAAAYPLTSVVVVGRRPPEEFAAAVGAAHELDVVATDDRVGPLGDADIVVTATRATGPLFGGGDVRAGTHVAAVGSSRPEARELDATVYARADRIGVEWREQAQREAGGLLDAIDAGYLAWDDVVELRDLVGAGESARAAGSEITVFQSVGIGLEDIAVAAVAVRRVSH